MAYVVVTSVFHPREVDTMLYIYNPIINITETFIQKLEILFLLLKYTKNKTTDIAPEKAESNTVWSLSTLSNPKFRSKIKYIVHS